MLDGICTVGMLARLGDTYDLVPRYVFKSTVLLQRTQFFPAKYLGGE